MLDGAEDEEVIVSEYQGPKLFESPRCVWWRLRYVTTEASGEWGR